MSNQNSPDIMSQHSIPKRLVDKLIRYFLLCIRAVLIGIYYFAIIGGVSFIIFMFYFSFGHALVYFFNLSLIQIIQIEAILTGILIAMRVWFFCKKMVKKHRRLDWHMIGCVFGVHDMEQCDTYWGEIGYNTHLIRTLKCPYCEVEDYEASYQSY